MEKEDLRKIIAAILTTSLIQKGTVSETVKTYKTVLDILKAEAIKDDEAWHNDEG